MTICNSEMPSGELVARRTTLWCGEEATAKSDE